MVTRGSRDSATQTASRRVLRSGLNHTGGFDESENYKAYEKQLQLIDQELERQEAAIRVLTDVEIEHSLTRLRLLRSYFSGEQMKANVVEFFKENFPNLCIVKNSDGDYEVQWNDKDDNLSMSKAPDALLFHALSGFELSNDMVRTSMLGADSLQMKDFVKDGPFESQMLADGLKTPGVSSQRMSIGMTPKSSRLPKPGEMLLSVRGSPLGVYKDDNINMEAIHGILSEFQFSH